jgi:outer membrane lipoprotein LolB
MKFSHLLIAFSYVAVLAGCSSLPKPMVEATPAAQALNQAHLKDIAGIDQFNAKGRIGVQAEGKGFSGGLTWQHTQTNDDIALFSPLGSQVANIKKNTTSVTLVDAKGYSISANDSEILTQKALGWQLPLTGLADWALGRPSNNAIQSSTWDEQGLLSSLKQDGWEIQYQNYADQNGHLLPSKITLRNDKVNLKLLIENWTNINSVSTPD